MQIDQRFLTLHPATAAWWKRRSSCNANAGQRAPRRGRKRGIWLHGPYVFRQIAACFGRYPLAALTLWGSRSARVLVRFMRT